MITGRSSAAMASSRRNSVPVPTKTVSRSNSPASRAVRSRSSSSSTMKNKAPPSESVATASLGAGRENRDGSCSCASCASGHHCASARVWRISAIDPMREPGYALPSPPRRSAAVCHSRSVTTRAVGSLTLRSSPSETTALWPRSSPSSGAMCATTKPIERNFSRSDAVRLSPASAVRWAAMAAFQCDPADASSGAGIATEA